MTSASVSKAQAFVDNFNQSYEEKHVAFENQFWGTKMALSSTDRFAYSTELLSTTKTAMEDLLSNPAVLKEAREHLEALKTEQGSDQEDLKKVLEVIVRTCKCNEFPTKESKSVREETNRIEGNLEKARNEMDSLGYADASGTFVPSSSVGSRTIMRTCQWRQWMFCLRCARRATRGPSLQCFPAWRTKVRRYEQPQRLLLHRHHLDRDTKGLVDHFLFEVGRGEGDARLQATPRG